MPDLTRPLTIGINALYLIPGKVGGTEIYLRRLMKALAELEPRHRYVVFTNRESREGLVPDAPNFIAAPQPVPARLRPARILWEQLALPISIARHGVDVLLNPGFTAPVLCSCPMVTVFHDLQHLRHPEYFRWFELPFWRFFLWAAILRSRHLISPSQATAEDLEHFYGVPPERISTVPHGVAPEFTELGSRRCNCATGRPYILAVSTLHRHKNLESLLDAFANFRRTLPEYELVIVGFAGSAAADLRRQVTELGLENDVRLTGWIPRTELYQYFAGARCFVYPSRFEGFGMPVLEALAAGIPAACSSIPPLAEIAGDGCLMFDPEQPDEICEALLRIATDEDLRTRLKARGPVIAAAYSWQASAEATLDVLVAAAGR